jgi:hypothetical protein
MHESDDKFADASSKCGHAMLYYCKEVTSTNDAETECQAALYTGSSTLIYADVIRISAAPEHAAKLEQLGVAALKYVIAHCPPDPHMIRAAKGILDEERFAHG